MKEIGGYFELELRKADEFHRKAIRLNSGHTAFEYILKANKYQKVWLPYFTCHIMTDSANRAGVQPLFYHIDKSFTPDFDFSTLKSDEGFVYTNYFGVCDNQVKDALSSCTRLIVDNAQAFYSKPQKGVDTFYSPRKFFGLPDGGYLFSDTVMTSRLRKDSSLGRFEHLLGRIEGSPEKYLDKFRNNDIHLGAQPIKRMSKITQRLLESIDYEAIAEIRRNNFYYLHKHLSSTNGMKLEINSACVPMAYPYLNYKKGLKELLLKNKIYVATYWPEVLKLCITSDAEYELANNLLALPVDQRYSLHDMKKILTTLSLI